MWAGPGAVLSGGKVAPAGVRGMSLPSVGMWAGPGGVLSGGKVAPLSGSVRRSRPWWRDLAQVGPGHSLHELVHAVLGGS